MTENDNCNTKLINASVGPKKNNNIQIIKGLLKDKEIDLNFEDEAETSAFIHILFSRHIEAIKLFLGKHPRIPPILADTYVVGLWK